MFKKEEGAKPAREGRDARPFGERARNTMKIYGGLLPADVKQLLMDMADGLDALNGGQA